jgi:imidazole glycerol-phosphate synthase subunit HisH
MLAIIDYGVGNLASIANMLKKIGVEASVTSNTEQIKNASKIILPGVGHFDNCMQMFNASGLRKIISDKVIDGKTPVLGICVGFQMLLESSEEGNEKGLGWIKGQVVKFRFQLLNGLKIPHMGWADVTLNKDSKLFDNMHKEPRFYFVHSYHPVVKDPVDTLVYANYGYPFVAAAEHENIMGVQFHPEKSHKFGMRLLENFVRNY